MLAIKEQAKQGVHIQAIDLQPLGAPQVAEFVADALHQDVATATPLAEIIPQKTGRQPVLHAAVPACAVRLEAHQLRSATKRVSLRRAAVKNAAITENVAEFLAAKIEKLPRTTRDVLRVAAAIGNRFDLRVLAGVSNARPPRRRRPAPRSRGGLDRAAVGPRDLDPEGLESPLVYAASRSCTIACSRRRMPRLSAADKPALHLAIGRVLCDGAPPAQLEGRLFDIVNHLNQATALIAERRAPAARRAQSTRRNARRVMRRHTSSPCVASGTQWRSSATTHGETTTRSCATPTNALRRRSASRRTTPVRSTRSTQRSSTRPRSSTAQIYTRSRRTCS